jgi:hypothetical protein
MWVAWMALACLQAVHVQGNQLEGRLSLEIPDHWELVHNRRAFGNHLVVMSGPDRCCEIRAQLIREDPGSRPLPLHVVADAISLGRSEHQGIHAEVLGGQSIEIAGRRGWASVLRKYHGPHEQLYTTVVTRGEEHLVFLSLQASRQAPIQITQDWDQVLNSLRLPEDPPREEPVFEPLPPELEDVGRVE